MKATFSGILSAVLLASIHAGSAAAADSCAGHDALRMRPIVLKPGEIQTIVYDFRDEACLSRIIQGLWIYLSDGPSANSEGCSVNVPKSLKGQMDLVDVTTGVQAMKLTGTSMIINDPVPDAEGGYVWGRYTVTGHLVELKIGLDSSVRKCLKVTLNHAYGSN